jgi:succinate-semialdehyde dehydrogenase / glutarate-semialdehyde dehydrogenase
MPHYPELQLYVAGEWRSRDGAPVINPADESILGTVPHTACADLVSHLVL